MTAVRAALEAAGAGAGDVRLFAHGMTVATNALLEGRGARTALVATDGFTDVVELGRQARRELYRLCAAHPAPLVPPERRFAAPERMGPDGVLRALEDDAARALAGDVAGCEPEAVAVCLLHAYRHPDHEQAVRGALRERLGDGVHISLSHETVGTFREYERAATTEVDAALSPLLAAYLRRLLEGAEEAGLPDPGDHAVQRRPGGRRRGRGARRADRAQRAGGRCGGGGAAGRALRGARPAVLRHGRHLVRRLRDPGRRRAGERGPRGRRPSARAADGRHPHRRRRRRLDRLARRRRRAARRTAVGRGRARAGLLRARRHRADRHRRQPRPRTPRSGRAAGRRRARRRRRASRGRRAGRRSWACPSRTARPGSSAWPTPRWSARCAS